MAHKSFKLEEGETILAVVPESCLGPGGCWVNRIFIIYIRTPDGKIREACQQPKEQSKFMATIFSVAEEISNLLKANL